jgi:D-alanyl-D-alanine carboxypeptidase
LITTKSGLLGIAIVVACAVGGMSAPTTAIRPIEPAVLQDTLDGLIKDLMVPGAMVLLRTPQGELVFGSGTTELGVASPPRADTHFRIASNTKTMTAAVIVLLAQDGKLRFDDPVSKYVFGVPNGDIITIAELLKMRSGLYNYTAAPELAESLDHEPTKAWTAEELLAIAFKRPPPSAPGKEFEYCNTNYVLLGLIAEKVEGEALARVFQNRLFAPLGMKDTLLPANTSSSIPEPYAHGYMYGGAAYALVDAPYPPDLQAAAKARTLKPNDDTRQNPSYALAAGGAISTAHDLSTWMRALVGGKVLNADTQRQWLESPVPQDPSKLLGQKYGYGISLITFGPNSMYFHGGEMPGYNSFMGHDPINDVTLVIWANLTVSLDGRSPANAIMLKMLDRIYAVSPLQQK